MVVQVSLPLIVSIVKPRMVIVFWARSPISFKHMFFMVSILVATPKPPTTQI